MHKVLIIGDSSTLPREEVIFSKTYYYELKKRNPSFTIENEGITNNTSYKIDTDLESFMLHGYNPDIVILNYGIVDVYPRPYPNSLYRLLVCTGLLPYVDKVLKSTNFYYRLGDLLGFKEVKLKNFEKYSNNIIKKLLERNVKKIIIISIIQPSKILLKSRSIKREVPLYNNIFTLLSDKYKEVNYIDIYNDMDEDFTTWDGYHYTEKASHYLTEKIEELINND